MAKEAKPRILAQKLKEARLKYMKKHNIDFIKMLELEETEKVKHEAVLVLYNKTNNTSKEMTLKGDYPSLLAGSELIFKGRMEDSIEASNYNLKIKEVKLIDKK